MVEPARLGGLKLSVFMFFISVTGTLAVLAPEIGWILSPEPRVAPGDERASRGNCCRQRAIAIRTGRCSIFPNRSSRGSPPR